MTMDFSWLHLTDFHQGMDEQDWLWPGIKDRFFEDMEHIYDKCGPWDLVLFTGDLTQKGSAEEFKKLNEILEQLWELFDKLQFSPKLLAVPGNHDLVRPDKKEPAVRLLQYWHDDPSVSKEFWHDENSPFRQVITKAFKNYTDWQKNHQFKPDNLNYGILPGDFSLTFKKGDAKLGIVGLNTSFLQLTGDDYEGKLVLHAQQFQNACGGDGPGWAKQHNACLLMTHHPPDWLNQESREQHLNGEIADRGRFATHLCGHLHETNSVYISEGGTKPKYIWQSCSLFGLEYFEKEGNKVERSHGYTIGKLELQGEQGILTFWPRRDNRLIGGERKIIPEPNIELNDKQCTTPRTFDLLNPYYDIFVSYAKVDNQPQNIVDEGWVSTLIKKLKKVLAQKIGRRDAYSFYMNDEECENETITPNIMKMLDNSRVLLLILSSNYLTSKKCQDEFKRFVDRVNDTERVFIVEYDNIQKEPKFFTSLSNRYQFWKEEGENGYYQKLEKIASDLTQKIETLREKTVESETTIKPIFLAIVSDDLEEKRQEIKGYLERQNIPVFPKIVYSITNIQEKIDEDLNQCQLFVQLLNEKSCKGLAQYQYDRAKAKKLPILQWRSPTLNLNHVHDEEHKKFLLQETVISSSLEDFKKHIINQLKPKETIQTDHIEKTQELLVFINAISENMELAYQIGNRLIEKDIGYALPLETSVHTKAADIQQDLEQKLLICDAVIVIYYDNTPVVWVNNQVLQCRKIQGQREQPFKTIAIYNKPSTDKPKLPIQLPNMPVLECSTPQVDTCLPEFLRILKQ